MGFFDRKGQPISERIKGPLVAAFRSPLIRRSVVFLFVFIYFLIFVYIKGHPSSDSGPFEENFMKRVQIQDDEETKCQR